LKQKVADLERELVFAKSRAILATAFPHLIKDPNAVKKKNPREERRTKRKAERKRKGK
jgi:hypothetical protein